MTQNVFGPPNASIYTASRYQGEYVTLNDLNEIVFTYTGRVSRTRESGYWVPVRRSTIVQVVFSMRVPAAVAINVTSSAGGIANVIFNTASPVNTYRITKTIPSGSLGGWVRMIVTPGSANTGEDLVAMLRFLEVS